MKKYLERSICRQQRESRFHVQQKKLNQVTSHTHTQKKHAKKKNNLVFTSHQFFKHWCGEKEKETTRDLQLPEITNWRILTECLFKIPIAEFKRKKNKSFSLIFIIIHRNDSRPPGGSRKWQCRTKGRNFCFPVQNGVNSTHRSLKLISSRLHPLRQRSISPLGRSIVRRPQKEKFRGGLSNFWTASHVKPRPRVTFRNDVGVWRIAHHKD